MIIIIRFCFPAPAMPQNLNVTATSTSMLLATWEPGNNSLQVSLANPSLPHFYMDTMCWDHADVRDCHWWELPQGSFLSRQKFCCDKHVCRDKHIFVVTKVLLQQTRLSSWRKYACHDKSFVATKIFGCDKQNFVTTKVLLQKTRSDCRPTGLQKCI